MTMQWEAEIALALKVATEAGRIAHDRPAHLPVEHKGSARDVVTAIDRQIEDFAREALSASGYEVIGEEATGRASFPVSSEAPVWVIDPIDGTAKYVNQLSVYGTSVGLCQAASFLIGAVCLPAMGEVYVAVSFASGPEKRGRQYELFGEVNDRTRGLGSAAANICLTAANRLQAAYGLDAKLWAVAGALAVAIGAGCQVDVAPSRNGMDLDYIVGSFEAVSMIRDACRAKGLVDG